MSNLTHTGFIIQARMGSTRMPGKVLLPFAGNKTILEIITERLLASSFQLPVCIATSVSPNDDAIAAFAKNAGVLSFRGSEDDVLDRFTGAAKENNFRQIIRVCADNPFLDTELLDELIRFSLENPADYASYEVAENLPAIRSHWGVFTEMVSLDSLEKAAALTNEKFYHEHVTNYIYGHPEIFRCAWKKAPEEVYGKTGIRFTIDTPEDFSLAQRIWSVLEERGIPINFRHALKVPDEFPEMRAMMQEQIRVNSK